MAVSYVERHVRKGTGRDGAALTVCAGYVLRSTTAVCPAILARLAEDDLLDPEARQGAAVEDAELSPE